MEQYATQIGLDLAQFKKDIADPAIKALVEKDKDLATKVNARGTPNFFINGRNLRGAVPFEDFDALVQEELAKAKKLVATGVAAADVYSKTIANGKTFEPLETKVNTFSVEGRPFKGNPNGDVVIYEFSDFQ